MVKVVGRDKVAVKRITCQSCASILEYTLKDTKTYTAGDYSGDTWTQYYIDCPVCCKKVNVRGY
jgi:hypothetical protein